MESTKEYIDDRAETTTVSAVTAADESAGTDGRSDAERVSWLKYFSNVFQFLHTTVTYNVCIWSNFDLSKKDKYQ